MDYNNGDLTNWAKQGILLLNKTKTETPQNQEIIAVIDCNINRSRVNT